MANHQKPQGILLDSGTNEVEFLLITLGKQSYGINVSKVCTIEVFDPNKLAPLPTSQNSCVLGVMSFRDKTISIIDLAQNLGWTNTPLEGSKRLLVVTEFNNRTTGFVVDGVDRIERFSWSQFEPITETTCNNDQVSVLGTVRSSEKLILIIDLENIMAKLDPTMSVEHYVPGIGSGTLKRSGIKILHCDDSVLIQKVVAKVLHAAGFNSITQLSNGEEALNYLKRQGENSFDVILCDIEMPKMDGLSLCKALREDKRFINIPIIFFSSLITEQMQTKCTAVGGDAAFSKPEINILVEELERLVQASRSEGMQP